MTDHPVHRDDITALRKEGDLGTYMRGLIATGPARSASDRPPPKKRGRIPPYHLVRPGAWPCGTAASGPSPQPCADCQPSHDARITAWTTRQAQADQQTGDDQ